LAKNVVLAGAGSGRCASQQQLLPTTNARVGAFRFFSFLAASKLGGNDHEKKTRSYS
jgi:hypothetical protein